MYLAVQQFCNNFCADVYRAVFVATRSITHTLRNRSIGKCFRRPLIRKGWLINQHWYSSESKVRTFLPLFPVKHLFLPFTYIEILSLRQEAVASNYPVASNRESIPFAEAEVWRRAKSWLLVALPERVAPGIVRFSRDPTRSRNFYDPSGAA